MKNQYSASEFVKMAYAFLLTKLTFRQARLIRRPIYIRGGASLSGCIGLTTGRFCRFDLLGSKKTLFIGTDCQLGDMTHIVAYNSVKIGSNVLIASKCFISDTNHGQYFGRNQDAPSVPPNSRGLQSGSTVIGNNVWIGENAVILSGARIGDGCIVGANSVVSKEIPAGSMVIGCNTIVKEWDDGSKKWVHI